MTSPHAASNIREASSFPDNWDIATIRELFKFSSGKARPKEIAETRSDSKPYPVFGGNGVMGFAADHLIGKPSLIIGRVGVYCGCAHHADGAAWISDNALYAKWVSERIDTRWARYFFEHANLNQYSSRAAQPLVSQGMLSGIRMPVPPKTEQRQIAQVLSAVQQAIERQERLIALTAELKKALMHKLFTEGTRGEPLKQTEIGQVPKSWRIKRITDLCSLFSGGTPSKSNAAFWNGPIPWASPKDMKRSRLSDTEDHISHAGLENGSRLAPAGSIFVVIRGMILIRDVPIAQAAVPMAFNQDMKALVGRHEVSSDFLLYSMQRAREQLSRKVGSSAHGTRTLMTSAIEQLAIGVPSASEQEAISQALKVTETKQNVHQRIADRNREFFRTLLHQFMTAHVRVHDLDLSPLDEPAGVT
jgi:type I restriction enzyme S subunit